MGCPLLPHSGDGYGTVANGLAAKKIRTRDGAREPRRLPPDVARESLRGVNVVDRAGSDFGALSRRVSGTLAPARAQPSARCQPFPHVLNNLLQGRCCGEAKH